MVDVQKTIKGLLSKFNARKDFENRKIVFWYDYDKTADENIQEIKEELSKHNKKVVILDNNFFEVKKILEHDSPNDDFLVYTQEKERPYEQNWLLDIQMYSSRFENSKIADVKSSFDIDGSFLDEFIEQYYDFFKSKARVDALKQLNYSSSWKETDFIKGFLAVLTKTRIIDVNMIVRNLLMNSLEDDDNVFWKDIEKFNLAEAFWDLIKKHYGYVSDIPTLGKLFYSFIVTHINFHSKIILKGYNQYINDRKNDCEVFLNSWLRDSKDFSQYIKYASVFESQNENELREQFSKIEPEKLQEIESLEFFDKLIILDIVNQLVAKGQDYSKYKSLIVNRKNKVWYRNYNHIYKALESSIDLFDFVNNEKIEQKSLEDIYELYKNKYYLADSYYRKFYEHYDQIDSDILKKKLKGEVENLYHNKFLDRLFDVWTKAVEHDNKKTWSIGTNPSQNEFYKLFVEKFSKSNNKVIVIISDAFRYEVANELQEELNSLRGMTELKDLVGLVPSVTKIGMASLLPHSKLSYIQNAVLCDGKNTQGIINRQKILQDKDSESIAIGFNDLNNLTRTEKRDLFKGKNVVYIYHDVIDETGDNAKSEHKVFLACKDAIKDIYNVINDLTNSVSASNIIVTADHGFIYKRESLEDFDKIQISISKDKVLDAKKRCLVTKENIEIDNTHKFELDYAEDGVFAYVPKGPLRFKTQGSGINFVHGGISPQEITIPVLYYKHARSDKELDKKQIKRGYVNVTLLNTSRKITTNITTVNLYQTEKVTDKLKPVKCRISLIDPDKKEKVSDEKEIIINSHSEDPEKRKYSVSLTLKSTVKNKKHLLRIYEEHQERILDEIPFEVDLAMTNDFDDF